MSQPLLALDHDWHRQRAQLRTGRLRPPPLVASGVDVTVATDGRAVTLGGLAVIFGVFPASLDEFVELARSRLHLSSGQAPELDAVLNTRIMAMWAWLPTMKRDCYLELDRATGAEQVWLVGPGSDQVSEIDLDDSNEDLDRAFLDALVLNGPGHWGGESGLTKLIERFGPQPLLMAAQVADLLDHHPQDPERALDILRDRWPQLMNGEESAWVPLAESEHPWVAVQLGRLALRLGHVRAARLLLKQSANADVAPVAHFDLGQACEVLGDLTTAESAFSRYASARATDPDAWRRLLLCRVRLGHFTIAEETLKRYRSVGGKDRDLVERFMAILVRSNLRAHERGQLVGWMCAHVSEALSRKMSLEQVIEAVIERRGESQTEALHLAALIDQLRIELRDYLPPSFHLSQIDDLVRVMALAVPLLASNTIAPIAHDNNPLHVAADEGCAAAELWALHALGSDFSLQQLNRSQAVLALARFAVNGRHDRDVNHS
jgi:tetratricopeptide (TPR) repeat protein